LLLGFGVAALRSVLLAATTDYSFILVGQVLGGVTTAIVEVLVIVIITDLTARTGRFNLVGGAVTMLLGIASSLSVAASGFIFSAVGHAPTFMSFAVIAGLATLFAWSMLPETKPAQYED
jgi:predicted MFS family arabinose efflux permease